VARGAADTDARAGVSKVGVVGYCMGGALSLATAVLVEEVDAAVVYYGTPSPQLADPAKLRKPVQLHFGDKDTYDFASPKTVNALEAKLRDAKATFELYRYAETGHAFANEFRPEVYHAPSHKLSQQRMIDFFKRFLRK
jgi:carboxymethylenebutenolidase